MMTATEQLYSKQLGDLIELADQQFSTIEITGIELDSRKIKPGNLFVALAGIAADGRKFINQAILAGAVAVVVEEDAQWSGSRVRKGIPVIAVTNLAMQLSAIAGQFYGHPSQHIPLIGVTGTNGKTTCTQLIVQLINQLSYSCGVIGTLGVGVDGNLIEGINTTPDAIAIQALLAQWRDQHVPVVAMEVSSHGLEQGRVKALQFDVAMFTNLTRDHLDYHGSMQAYAKSKTLLFQQPGLKKAVINVDDAFGETLAQVVANDVDMILYSSRAQHSTTTKADVWVENVIYHSDYVSADMHTPWGSFPLKSPLLGAFNLTNVLAVIGCIGSLGYPVSALVQAVASISAIAGRMERINSPADITVVIDYAHTPDALEKALVAMRQHTSGKLWCVFGCGGDRDQGKRPQMGEVVQRFSDHVVVTNDNPRTENAADIINQILGGVDRPSLVEEDRATAIDFVIANASPGDSVLIAGKGHEDYQVVGKQRIPFSDSKQARLALAKRAAISKGAD